MATRKYKSDSSINTGDFVHFYLEHQVRCGIISYIGNRVGVIPHTQETSGGGDNLENKEHLIDRGDIL